MVDSIFIWNYKTRFKWQWIEFADFREYEPWDDVKHIDWVTSAKMSKIYIKKYIEERLLNSIFLIDIWEWMNFWMWKKSKLDLLIEVFTILAFSSVKNWDMVWVLIYDNQVVKYFPPKKWKLNVLIILRFIYKLFEDELFKVKIKKDSFRIYWKSESKENERTINVALSFLVKYKIKNSLVFTLTDQIRDFEDRKMKISWLKNDFVFINIFDEFENHLNYDWIFNFVDSGIFMQIDTKNKKLKEKYVNYRKEKISNLKKKLSRYWIDYLSLDNKTNIFSYFFKYFKYKQRTTN